MLSSIGHHVVVKLPGENGNEKAKEGLYEYGIYCVCK